MARSRTSLLEPERDASLSTEAINLRSCYGVAAGSAHFVFPQDSGHHRSSSAIPKRLCRLSITRISPKLLRQTVSPEPIQLRIVGPPQRETRPSSAESASHEASPVSWPAGRSRSEPPARMDRRRGRRRASTRLAPKHRRLCARSAFTTPREQSHHALSITHPPNTSESIPLRKNVLNASSGVFTIGSPFRLKDVFSTTGTPVA